MKLRISITMILIAVAVGCSSMKVNHDYDRQAAFSSFKSFAWHDSGTNVADTDPLAHERFVNAVNSQLRTHGLSEVSSNPDIFVTYNAEESQQMSLSTTYMGGGWGYGPGWGWGGYGGMGSSTTQVREYSVGTLVLDMWDAKQKRLVWRGVVSDTISDNPQKIPPRSRKRPRNSSKTTRPRASDDSARAPSALSDASDEASRAEG